jgi:hypothetical protein
MRWPGHTGVPGVAPEKEKRPESATTHLGHATPRRQTLPDRTPINDARRETGASVLVREPPDRPERVPVDRPDPVEHRDPVLADVMIGRLPASS